MLFAPEALVVVAFAFEELLEMGFAVKFTLKSCEGAKATGNKRKQSTVTSDRGKEERFKHTNGHDLSFATIEK